MYLHCMGGAHLCNIDISTSVHGDYVSSAAQLKDGNAVRIHSGISSNFSQGQTC